MQGKNTTENEAKIDAVYHFMAWLVSRPTSSGPFSAHHEATPGLQLVREFCQHKGWLIEKKNGIEPLLGQEFIEVPHEKAVQINKILPESLSGGDFLDPEDFRIELLPEQSKDGEDSRYFLEEIMEDFLHELKAEYNREEG